MKRMMMIAAICGTVCLCAGGTATASTAGTAFTYQGSLTDGAGTANGTYDFQFSLFSVDAAGLVLSGPITVNDVQVADGLFTVQLDFGAGYLTGDARWLEIAVRPGANGGAYTTLMPRQELKPAPYAIGLALPYSGYYSSSSALFYVTQAGAGPGMSVLCNGAGTAVGGYINNNANSNPALVGNTNGSGNALFAYNWGMGRAATLQINNASNASDALNVTTNGTGRAATFQISNSSSSARAVHATTNGTGYAGYFSNSNFLDGDDGLYASSAQPGKAGVHGSGFYGVLGEGGGSGGVGVYGMAAAPAAGVKGENTAGGTGVYGLTSSGYAVYGLSNFGRGVFGQTSSGYGVYGDTTGSGYAGYFNGKVHVNGTLSKSSGSFKIDHPLDPANMYLYHSFVESPDMKNIYDGVVVLDENGEADVRMPDWFEALNKDFRYQLTCIGGYSPVYVAEEMKDMQFKVAGGRPGMKVSWQVTGTRHDAFAEAHRIPVEEPKSDSERGMYLHPELFGQPAEMSVAKNGEIAVETEPKIEDAK